MMSREIKFRAWDGKGMRYWGFLEDGAFQGIPTESGGLKYPQMQYTGLKDKNGMEIYEGDVAVYDDGSGGEVVYSSGCFHFKGDEKNPSQLGIHNKGIEVIGNIYENPELLQ